jgi:hypothetical protein
MSDILQLKHHKAMWCNGRKFRIKQLDETRKTSDSGITVVFQVTNVSSMSDRHPRQSKNRYYGFLNDIIECDFNSFKLFCSMSNGIGYKCMNMMRKEPLFNMPTDFR